MQNGTQWSPFSQTDYDMTRKPTEIEIQKVMQETGMAYVQAYRHLVQRYQIQADMRRNPPKYSMGKSCYDTDTAQVYCPFNTINS